MFLGKSSHALVSTVSGCFDTLVHVHMHIQSPLGAASHPPSLCLSYVLCLLLLSPDVSLFSAPPTRPLSAPTSTLLSSVCLQHGTREILHPHRSSLSVPSALPPYSCIESVQGSDRVCVYLNLTVTAPTCFVVLRVTTSIAAPIKVITIMYYAHMLALTVLPST